MYRGGVKTMTIDKGKEIANNHITWHINDINELVKSSLKELTEAQDSYSGYFHIMEQVIAEYKFHCDRISEAKSQLQVIEALEKG